MRFALLPIKSPGPDGAMGRVNALPTCRFTFNLFALNRFMRCRPSRETPPRLTLLLASAIAFWPLSVGSLVARGQIVPDNSLPTPSSVVPNCTDCVIDGGTVRGGNLFHSFEAFSIPNGGRGYFNNAAAIERIFSRVTGRQMSRIDGLLQANGTADVFLLNPNGIVFGPGASLNIGGSFVGTSADRVLFADDTFFSATPTDAAPLLTLAVPVGVQFGANPGAIALQATVLDSARGETVAFLGGDLDISASTIQALGGRVELGAVGANGLVDLTTLDGDGDRITLDYSPTNAFGTLTLSRASVVGVGGSQRGAVQIQGRRVSLLGDSQVVAIATADGAASDIQVRASETLRLVGQSIDTPVTGIFNVAEGNATGAAGGELVLDAPTIRIRQGAQVSSETNGTGRGSPLTVTASDLLLAGGLADGASGQGNSLPSGLFARSQEGATGAGGALTIESDRLTLRNGAQISTDTRGAGAAGTIDITATQSMDVLGRLGSDLRVASGVFAQVSEGATGNGGTLRINTPVLQVTGGAQISTAARSGGAGGNLIINDRLESARLIRLSGTANIDRNDNISGLLVSAEEGATEDAGSLWLQTDTLIVEDGARISADNRGSGQGGSATLRTRRLIGRDRGQILAASFADNPTDPGFDPTTATSGGPAGSLDIVAETLQLSNGSEISVRGEDTANAGTIRIIVNTLGIQNSSLSASTERGTAGSINITTIGSAIAVSGDDAEISVQATAGGRAGNLSIDTRRLTVTEGATLSVSSPEGEAGNLLVRATDIALDDGTLTAETGQTPANGSGANIVLSDATLLFLTDNSDISAEAFNRATGGNITINAASGFITTPADQDSNIIANASVGQGGQIDIVTQGLFGLQERPNVPITNDIDASSDFGLDGTVTITRIEVDPSRGLVALPTDTVDVSRLIAQQCNAQGQTARRRQSEFVMTGQGGLTPPPTELMGHALWDDLRLFQSNGLSLTLPYVDGEWSPDTPPTTAIVEAQGWTADSTGKIHLSAETRNSTGLFGNYGLGRSQPLCRGEIVQ